MSFDTNRNWFYELSGRFIHLWQYIESGATDTVEGYKIRLPGEYYGNQLIYPNEDITDGLRIEYTALHEPFVAEALETTSVRESSSIISFEDGTGGSSRDLIDLGTNSGNEFANGDKIRVIGSASNDGDYTIVLKAVDGGTGYQQLEVAAGSFTIEAVGESITIYQIPKTVDDDGDLTEASHVNLNRMLSLAVVDYVKAQLKDAEGDIQQKEYYMREFWKKVGDNESNKRSMSVVFPISPFAVK